MLESMLRFGAFSLATILGPGVALQRLAGVAADPALVLPVGLAFCAGAYWTSLVLGLPWLFPVLAAGSLAGWAARRVVGRTTRRVVGGIEGPALSGALPSLAGIVTFLALTQYSWNRLGPDGEFVLDPLVPYDTAFHVGLSRELVLGHPPQVPGLAGFPLGYHLGIDLVRAAALRWAGVDPYDSVTRFDATLGAFALVLLLRSATRRLGGSRLAVALAPWTLLATDFSYVFGWSDSVHWWTDLLRGNLLVSLALANPVIPALALALGALVALSRYTSGEGRGWLFLAGAQALAVPFFKVFLGAHLLLGLGLAAVLRRRAAGPVLAVALPAALATAALVLGQGGETIEIRPAPLDLVERTREAVGLPPATGWSLAAWTALWLGASLGARLLGIPAALTSLRREPLGATLAAMALSAWPLGLLFRVSAPEVLPGQKVVNDAAYLVEQGGPLLWIFTVVALGRLSSPARRVSTAVALCLLSLPSTAQFIVQKNRWPNDAIPAPRVRAMRALEARSAAGEVVLQRPGARFPAAPVVLIGRRVPYERFTPWLTQFAARADLEARHALVYRFFRTRERDEAAAIARQLGARWLCLYDQERVRFDGTGFLEPVHEEPGARCSRILVDGAAAEGP